MSEIPFWFHDRPKWVSGISRSTTCQDVLHSLLRAHAAKTQGQQRSADEVRSAAKQLVLVEQWRGVERPLAGGSRILKLWQAWGEERSQVKFIVKRMSISSSSGKNGDAPAAGVSSAASYSSLTRGGRRARRRNSRLSSASSAGQALHPSALVRTAGLVSSSSSSGKTGDIERLMRVILTQGETIHAQLRRLQEREGQVGYRTILLCKTE